MAVKIEKHYGRPMEPGEGGEAPVVSMGIPGIPWVLHGFTSIGQGIVSWVSIL